MQARLEVHFHEEAANTLRKKDHVKENPIFLTSVHLIQWTLQLKISPPTFMVGTDSASFPIHKVSNLSNVRYLLFSGIIF